MSHPIHLRTRVFRMTASYAVLLLVITAGLSWRADRAQKRWSHLIRTETRAIAALEELLRAQNSFLARIDSQSGMSAEPLRGYVAVRQLLASPALTGIELAPVRGAMERFERTLEEDSKRIAEGGRADRRLLDLRSAGISRLIQSSIDREKSEVERELPSLDAESRNILLTGLGTVWIIIILSFAVTRMTLARVVRPLEELSDALERIAGGDLDARAQAGGDFEIAALGRSFNRMAGALIASQSEMRRRARTDDLTMLPNFRAFRERLESEIERASRYPGRFGLLVLDLDRFKQYNDRFGHLAGNEALQRVSRVIRETVRTVDFPARFGGEEFAVIVPQIDEDALRAIAERIRRNIETLPPAAGADGITVSIGASIYPIDGLRSKELFIAADARLYEAKEAGRNRVVSPAPVQKVAAPDRT
jgi:diguanylate cyclase (GGDEF)-like protein